MKKFYVVTVRCTTTKNVKKNIVERNLELTYAHKPCSVMQVETISISPQKRPTSASRKFWSKPWIVNGTKWSRNYFAAHMLRTDELCFTRGIGFQSYICICGQSIILIQSDFRDIRSAGLLAQYATKLFSHIYCLNRSSDI